MPGAESLHEACGVFGIYAPGEDVARLTFFGLYASSTAGRRAPASPPATAPRCTCTARWAW
jgi:amidophosphoribosyltransferase